MKKFFLLLLSITFCATTLWAQTCACKDVSFSITGWVCKGKNPQGHPVYEGRLTVKNGTNCTFTLTQIMQQTGGDVTLTLPFTVAPGSSGSRTIVYTDVPPYSAVGSTPYFIVVYKLNEGTCKWEFPSEKLPSCATGCDCTTNGWQSFSASIKNVVQTVKCGHQFSITCADTVRLKGLYKCTEGCSAKYSAVLKNTATNTVVQTYSSFTFPWAHRFLAPGTYSLEISSTCGDKKCGSCRFFFTVSDCAAVCDCKPNGWASFMASIGSAVQQVQCGHQFGVGINVPVKLQGRYVCSGNCTAKYSATLTNASTGALVKKYLSFTFPWNYSFVKPGTYKLEITPVCGKKRCSPCVFYFTVRGQ